MGVMRATDQVTIVEGGIGDTTELEAKVEELNNNLNSEITRAKNAETTLTNDLSNKQDKLINPITQSDVVNNLTSTSANKPLSAYQGKLLNDSLNWKNGSGNQATSDSWATITNFSNVYNIAKEVIIRVVVANNIHSLIIPMCTLLQAEAQLIYRLGGRDSIVNVLFDKYANNGTLQVVSCIIDGTNYINNCYIDYFYR